MVTKLNGKFTGKAKAVFRDDGAFADNRIDLAVQSKIHDWVRNNMQPLVRDSKPLGNSRWP